MKKFVSLVGELEEDSESPMVCSFHRTEKAALKEAKKCTKISNDPHTVVKVIETIEPE